MERDGSRTTVRRKADRGHYERATIDAILDEGFVCHVGFIADAYPVVLPTAYARVGDHLYLHGAAGNRMLQSLAGGAEACVTVTLIDGLVLSRSAFHHSMNYRSVVVFGKARRVEDDDEKRRAMEAVVEHVVLGRTHGTRAPSAQELRATLVVRLPLDEASAKVRSGGPIEEPGDLALEFWGGELPLRLVAGIPVGDGQSPHAADDAAPAHVRDWRRLRS